MLVEEVWDREMGKSSLAKSALYRETETWDPPVKKGTV